MGCVLSKGDCQNTDFASSKEAGGVEVPPLDRDTCEVPVDVPKLTDAVLKGLDLILRHHGASKDVRAALEIQVHRYADCDDVLVWFKRIKYVLAYPMARYLRNDLPPAPDKVFKPSGALRGWMKARLNAFNRKNTHLWSSWLQAKRSALPLPPTVVEKTYDDHFARLSGEDCGRQDVIDDIMDEPHFRRVLNGVRKQLKQRYPARRDYLEEMPSLSACFESTRSKGGSYGYLSTLVGIGKEETILPTELVSMTFVPWGRVNGHWVHNTVYETREKFGRDLWSCLDEHVEEDVWDRPSEGDEINCTIQAILEPLKVRVISKGESLPYYYAKPLQKALHGILRQMPCFRLIGRTFCPTDLIDLDQVSQEGDKWFSIDYSAATDGLSAKYSRRILDFVLQDLDYDTRTNAERVLGMHRLWYPTGGCPAGKEYRGLQKTGQLMGSPLSFPILCLANLGVYLRNTHDLHKERQLTYAQRLNGVLVNGDDMIYRAPQELWEGHVVTGRAVGLEMSVGKAYMHEVYANINSVAVHHRHESNPWVIDFLNTGLFFGQNKVLADDRDGGSKERESKSIDSNRLYAMLQEWNVADTSIGIVANTDKVVSGSLPGRQGEILGMYLREHQVAIRSETTGVVVGRGRKPKLFTRNLFLPISRGGMGVTLPHDFKTVYTRIQRKVARSLSRGGYRRGVLGDHKSLDIYDGVEPGGHYGYSTQRPLGGWTIEEVEAQPTRPWQDRSPPTFDYIFEVRSRVGVRGEAWKRDIIPFSGHRHAVVVSA